MSAHDDMRLWPEALRVNFEATRLAPMIYYCQHQVYGGSGMLWDALSPASKNLYIAVAGNLLQTFKPEAPKPNPGTLSALRLVRK